MSRMRSHRHEGHAGHRPGGENHFRLYIVSEAFRGKSRIERHRMINAALASELAGGVHALAIHAAAPGEAEPERRISSYGSGREAASPIRSSCEKSGGGSSLAIARISLAHALMFNAPPRSNATRLAAGTLRVSGVTRSEVMRLRFLRST